ncbi:OmpA family protein [Cyclobacterium sp. 1_MG-2023]|uniref:OmpA family protein n=1 Tax=Cyclobacterium sp. 1_MG-2023 TaxID=3062681 RepID=UPI0026E464BD|nr:OmpA family protein [Cyclobacterium sp. 1_MG-2023]MDO6437461.1 OmpA family protein [Cyclobacterium sp. 1_MG-2023]
MSLLLYQSTDLLAQLNPYKLRIGTGIGYSNYYGDISHYRFDEFPDWDAMGKVYSYNNNYNLSPSISLSIEQRINASWGLLLNGGQYTLSMSDRFVDNKDVLITNSPNFYRSLNFKTCIRDIGLGLIFRTDNGKILRENALVAPYLSFHGGWLAFKPKGDLLDVNGNRYDYSQNLPLTDGDFETDLVKLQASSNNGYNENTYYLAAGIGFRVKLTRQVEVYFQSDIKRTNTDFIDDVDGSAITTFLNEFQEYAAYPGIGTSSADRNVRGDLQTNKDWFFNHQFGLKISFLPAKDTFRANPISPSSTFIGLPQTINDGYTERDSSKITSTSSLVINPLEQINETIYATDRKTLPKVNTTQEIPAQIAMDSINNFSTLNFRRKEIKKRTDRLMIWQYPERINDSEIVYAQERGTIYSPYSVNKIEEQMYPQVNERFIVDPSDGQVNNSNFPYFLPYYNRHSTFVNQPANIGDSMGIDSTLTTESSTFLPLDSIQMDSINSGFKPTHRPYIVDKKFKFETPAPFQGISLQFLNSGKEKPTLIENGLYTEIFFESNKSIISEKEVLKLIPLIKMLDLYDNAKLLVKAFADNTGSMAYNIALIEKRALAVEEILTNQFGVASVRISRQPGALLIRGSYQSSRPKDRKVEVQVIY